MRGIDDTIVAISTAVGQGGIGIVRISGADALSIADGMFVGKSRTLPSQCATYTVHYGWVVEQLSQGESVGRAIVDEVLMTVMRAPHSYTTEDVVEFSCHGGIVSLRAILYRAVALGARLAEPGEFTKRAFLNGRIDLPQAEAVLDIIQAKTDAFLQVSAHQLKGDLSVVLGSIRERLLAVYGALEAVVNFPEEGIDALTQQRLGAMITEQEAAVEKLLFSRDHGRILKDGIKIVICGKPNVGKSSLLNALLKTPRAIVSPISGTTRDTIEETAHIQGIPFQVVDTAGIMQPRDQIEEDAVRRSHMHIKSADLVLVVLDASAAKTRDDEAFIRDIPQQARIVVCNKSDLPRHADFVDIETRYSEGAIACVSATKRVGFELLEKTIVEKAWHGTTVSTAEIVISNMRHVAALQECRDALSQAATQLASGTSAEFISELIKQAVSSLDTITGRDIDSDLIDHIFSQFCIGK